MKIHIISVGKLSGEFASIAKHYEKITNWQLKNTEITYGKKLPENQIKQFEAGLIKKYIGSSACKIVLDVKGQQYSSEDFAGIFRNKMMIGQNIDFIIGGAFGLDQSILKLADYQLSLSKMTMPHALAKIILLEQIYRAKSIIDNHPYHK